MPQVQNRHATGNDKVPLVRNINRKSKINISRIVNASLSGLAGGVVLTTVIVGATASLVVAAAGSLAGAALTGYAEYAKEKREMQKH